MTDNVFAMRKLFPTPRRAHRPRCAAVGRWITLVPRANPPPRPLGAGRRATSPHRTHLPTPRRGGLPRPPGLGLRITLVRPHRRWYQPLSHAASRRDSSPFRGAERWAEVCGVCASVCRDADTVVFLPPVRGGVLDAPRSLDCRAALDASVRHTCASLRKAGFRLYSRAKSGSGCKNAPQKLRGVMGLFQSYSQMKPICPEYIAG